MLVTCSDFIPHNHWATRLEGMVVRYVENKNTLTSITDQRAAMLSSLLPSTGISSLVQMHFLLRSDDRASLMPDAAKTRILIDNPHLSVCKIIWGQRIDIP